MDEVWESRYAGAWSRPGEAGSRHRSKRSRSTSFAPTSPPTSLTIESSPPQSGSTRSSCTQATGPGWTNPPSLNSRRVIGARCSQLDARAHGRRRSSRYGRPSSPNKATKSCSTGSVRALGRADTEIRGPGVWDRAARLLPTARRLAGTFAKRVVEPTASAPSWPRRVPTSRTSRGLPSRFRDWLSPHTEPVEGTEHDAEPGVVFAWTEHGELAHATVTVGAGWMLTKPSQSWSSPRMIWTVREAVNSWRYPDTRLSRHRLRR